MYADDTAVFYFGDDLQDVQLSMQHDLQLISFWMHQNRLSLNVKKNEVDDVRQSAEAGKH